MAGLVGLHDSGPKEPFVTKPLAGFAAVVLLALLVLVILGSWVWVLHSSKKEDAVVDWRAEMGWQRRARRHLRK